MVDWDAIKYFKKSEFSNPDKLSNELILRLDKLRELLNVPCHIHSDYREGDSGFHGKGLAVDVHFQGIGTPGSKMRLFEIAIVARQMGFKGVGMYPYWNDPGLHLDLRTNPTYWFQDNLSHWTEEEKKTGKKYVYI